MNYKKKILLKAGILLIIIIFLITIDNLTKKGMCDFDIITGLKYFTCVYDQLLQAIGVLSLCLFIFLPPLYFLREEVYLAWRKFALWYLPIVAIPISFAGNSDSFGLTRELFTFYFSILFLTFSICIMIFKQLELKHSWKLVWWGRILLFFFCMIVAFFFLRIMQ